MGNARFDPRLFSPGGRCQHQCCQSRSEHGSPAGRIDRHRDRSRQTRPSGPSPRRRPGTPCPRRWRSNRLYRRRFGRNVPPLVTDVLNPATPQPAAISANPSPSQRAGSRNTRKDRGGNTDRAGNTPAARAAAPRRSPRPPRPPAAWAVAPAAGPCRHCGR
jgi:hypothetical protein